MLKAVRSRRQFDFRSLRGIQIATVFTFTIFFQEALRYPHAGYTGFAVMMIYAGFDNGATLSRCFSRFLGMLLGLESGYILWFIGHLDYRTLTITIPMMIFFAYYFVRREYSVPTVFTVNTSLIGTGYFSNNTGYSVTFFLTDYFVATLIAFSFIVIFEALWFSRYNMMERFIEETQVDVMNKLFDLFYLLQKKKIKHRDWYKECMTTIGMLAQVHTLFSNSRFEKKAIKMVGEQFHQFVALTTKIYTTQKALYFAHDTKRYGKYDYEVLLSEIENDLRSLKKLLLDRACLYKPSEVLSAKPT